MKHIFEADKKDLFTPDWKKWDFSKLTANRAKVVRSDPKKNHSWILLRWFFTDCTMVHHPQTTIFRENIFCEKPCPSIEGRNTQIHSLISPCSNETNRCFGSSYVHRASCSSNTDRFPWRRGPRKRTARGFPGDGWVVVEGWSESYAENRRVFLEKISKHELSLYFFWDKWRTRCRHEILMILIDNMR